MTPATIARIKTQFHLPAERTEVTSDFHYQSTETTPHVWIAAMRGFTPRMFMTCVRL
jgi:hypothetical protein